MPSGEAAKSNGTVVSLAFASSYEMESKEYLLYDFPRITAAVGGAMGLFLGVSLIQGILIGIDKLFGEKQDEENEGSLELSKKRLSNPIAVKPFAK